MTDPARPDVQHTRPRANPNADRSREDEVSLAHAERRIGANPTPLLLSRAEEAQGASVLRIARVHMEGAMVAVAGTVRLSRGGLVDRIGLGLVHDGRMRRAMNVTHDQAADVFEALGELLPEVLGGR